MFDFLREKAAQPPPELPKGTVRRRYRVQGVVQGVGFRYRARYAAESLGLTGWVCNEEDGTVTLEVQGRPEQMETLFLRISQSPYIQIQGLEMHPCPQTPGSAASVYGGRPGGILPNKLTPTLSYVKIKMILEG